MFMSSIIGRFVKNQADCPVCYGTSDARCQLMHECQTYCPKHAKYDVLNKLTEKNKKFKIQAKVLSIDHTSVVHNSE